MLTNRQKLLLKAIVEEYVKQGTPIGSKSLIDKPYLQFSSATLRFEMAKLEELGFLEKTHTSSGRVPSRKGYQYYVDNLLTRDYDVIDDFPSIDEIFSVSKYSNREDTIKKALELDKQHINTLNHEGNAPIHKAALLARNTEVLKLLVAHGASKTTKTEFEETAYELAENNDYLKQKNIDISFLKS